MLPESTAKGKIVGKGLHNSYFLDTSSSYNNTIVETSKNIVKRLKQIQLCHSERE